MFVACAALLLGMQSCDLEEYNPAGSTPDNVYKEQAGFEALVNSAYAFGAVSFMDVKICVIAERWWRSLDQYCQLRLWSSDV